MERAQKKVFQLSQMMAATPVPAEIASTAVQECNAQNRPVLLWEEDFMMAAIGVPVPKMEAEHVQKELVHAKMEKRGRWIAIIADAVMVDGRAHLCCVLRYLNQLSKQCGSL